ncbi:hypothetical protein [Litchfieldia alkalitelluris]|uniref:hypothetical protein n=1 Tax=Litchfieldia alkalitelluris TaxID=304268 RepID=UPI0009985E06|nr:hypothetical protein [Litchfieldia alkalitelluris]
MKIDVSDFIENMEEMTNEELKHAYGLVTTLYLSLTEYSTKFYGIDEYFRTQVDMIADYLIKHRFNNELAQYNEFMGITKEK